ncbi:septation ring formation regulator EzrA [Aneurinibacillus sp. Ricciae_BoGa-3]|uniref:septation ring formation regulator EzrA n=1 Tax=Aneurinibacillus sp. Ricciae_BoGa-3 TaxID=3022697 RepID=UPI0023420BE4|nr:septation ring formation regulator EzrA [Aneurinibacillus sp. Ricciae_BoGa-3]WCK55781.1 septation ring formation regulator EzrA [Aneurinibacillus sp. Ricciae_BoGa-3]
MSGNIQRLSVFIILLFLINLIGSGRVFAAVVAQPLDSPVNDIAGMISGNQENQASGLVIGALAASAPAAKAANVETLPMWLMTAVGLLIAAAIVVVWAYVQRSRILKQLDEVDEWRDRLLGELNDFSVGIEWKKEPLKVRERYLQILTALDDMKKDAIADVELILADAEETLGKFRFRRGREIIQEAKVKLQRIEDDFFQLGRRTEKLSETLGDIRSLTAEVEEQQLKIERRLDELRIQYSASFHAIKEQVNQFSKESLEIRQMWEKGEFEPCKDKLLKLYEGQKNLFEAIQKLPFLRQTIEKDLHQEIRQLDDDCTEMMDQGYTNRGELFAAALAKIKSRAEQLPTLFEDGRTSDVESEVAGIREQIESVYQSMEEIVTSRQQYRKYLDQLPYQLSVLEEDEKYLKTELDDLSQRYQVEEGEAFQYYQQIPEVLAEISHALSQAAGAADEDASFERSRETLAQASERAAVMIERRETVMSELKEFRKGELTARQTVGKLKTDVVRVELQLKRVHLPGIPEEVCNQIKITRDSIVAVEYGLEEVPLNMQKVEHFMKEARDQVITLLENAAEMIRICKETEEKIQRTNRFRRYDREIAGLLSHSEKAFRNCQYEEAFELANKAYHLAAERFDN